MNNDNSRFSPVPRRRRVTPCASSLTDADAAIVKGMLVRGDAQQNIAQWFRVNQARIGEIVAGAKFAHVAAAPADALPPPGPYLPPMKAAAREALSEARLLLERVENLISKAA